MAKSRQPTAPASQSAVALAEPPAPSYAAPPHEVLESDNKAFDELREICRNASYSLLDFREGRWRLLVFGGYHGGSSVRTFDSYADGIEFVKDAALPNVLSFKLMCHENPRGLIQ
jgi:hypothetical protein